MKLQNVLLKSITLGAVVVSLSPLASVATLAHADGYVKSANTITTTTPVDSLSIAGGGTIGKWGGDGAVTALDQKTHTITVSSNKVDFLTIVIATKENGRDIFAGLADPLAKSTKTATKDILGKSTLNVPGYVDGEDYGVTITPTGTHYEFDLKDLDLTGVSQIAVTFHAKDTGLSKDYSAFVNIKRTF